MATTINFAYGLFVACMLSGSICLIAAIYFFKKSFTFRQKLAKQTKSNNSQKTERIGSRSLDLDIESFSNYIHNDSKTISSPRSSKHEKILNQHMLNHFTYADLQNKWKNQMQQNDINDTYISTETERSCVLKNIPHKCTQTKNNAYVPRIGDQRIQFTKSIQKHRDFVW